MRTVVFWGLYWGPLIFGKLPYSVKGLFVQALHAWVEVANYHEHKAAWRCGPSAIRVRKAMLESACKGV